MPAHMSLCHTLGIRIRTVIMHSNFSSFKPRDSNIGLKGNSLRLRVNRFKYKVLRLRLKGSQDEKSLAWMLMSSSIG